MPGWKDRKLRRNAVSLGLIDPVAGEKYLFEASPDLREQLYLLDSEAPATHYEMGGIFLTHAHMGHYAGLMFLGYESMNAEGIPVFAMPRMKAYLAGNGPWSQLVTYQNIRLVEQQEGRSTPAGTVKVTPFLVPHRDEFSEAVGYRIEGPGKSALFIPDIDKWPLWERSLADEVTAVDHALIDATFFADGELPGRDMSRVRHPFVVESMERLDHLPAAERAKVWFIHINHTNPLLDPDSDESRQVRDKGYNVAVEGLRLPL